MKSCFRKIFALPAFLAMVACSDNYVTKINEINTQPIMHIGKTVTIGGIASYAIGLGGYGTFTVTDETGSITVITNKGVPKSDTRLEGITGVVSQPITFGDKSILLILQGDISIDNIMKLLIHSDHDCRI